MPTPMDTAQDRAAAKVTRRSPGPEGGGLVADQAPGGGEQALDHDGGHSHRRGVHHLPAQVLLLGTGVFGLVRPPRVVVARLVATALP